MIIKNIKMMNSNMKTKITEKKLIIMEIKDKKYNTSQNSNNNPNKRKYFKTIIIIINNPIK